MARHVRQSGDRSEADLARSRVSWRSELPDLVLCLLGITVWCGSAWLFDRSPVLAAVLGAALVTGATVGAWSWLRRHGPVARWERAARAWTLVALVVLACVLVALPTVLSG